MTFIVKSIQCQVRLVPLGRTGQAWAEAFLRGIPVAWTRITSTEGVFGDSLVQVDPTGELVPAMLAHDDIAPRVVGARVSSPSELWHRLRAKPRGQDWRAASQTALAAIDIALWDLYGKIHGVPLHEVFGAVRDSVPAYVSWGLGRSPLPELATAYQEEMARIGSSMVKTALGNFAPAEDVARMAFLRGELGERVDIAVDAQAQWDRETAITAIRGLSAHAPYWIEEPTRGGADDTTIERLAIAPISTGENIPDVPGFAALLEHGFRGNIQPDPVRLGGLTPLREVVSLANAHATPVSPHCYREYAIFAATAATAGAHIEHWGLQNIVHDACYCDPLYVTDGTMHVTDRPGIGEVVDPEKFARCGEPLSSITLAAD